jgi:hypothetical protein
LQLGRVLQAAQCERCSLLRAGPQQFTARLLVRWHRPVKREQRVAAQLAQVQQRAEHVLRARLAVGAAAAVCACRLAAQGGLHIAQRLRGVEVLVQGLLDG